LTASSRSWVLELASQTSDAGHGISTLIMAKAFPKSESYGFDSHPASIEAANSHAQDQQITNVRFSIAAAKDFPGNDYGFVTVFDALHDMGDPVGAASHVKQALQQVHS